MVGSSFFMGLTPGQLRRRPADAVRTVPKRAA
jgi:hypothetical protein